MQNIFRYQTQVVVWPRHLTSELGGAAIGKDEFMPMTCLAPQECLDLLEDREQKEDTETKAQKVERQWGELELRLSFFTQAYHWI